MKKYILFIIILFFSFSLAFTGGPWIKQMKAKKEGRDFRYVGASYNHFPTIVYNPQYRYNMTQGMIDSFDLQMTRISIDWNDWDNFPDSTITAIMDTLIPGNVKWWIDINTYHATKMRTLPYEAIELSIHNGPPKEEYELDWKKFLIRVINMFPDKIKVIQIDNEPFVVMYDEYMRWLGTVREWGELIVMSADTIKAYDPDMLVWCGGSTGAWWLNSNYISAMYYIFDTVGANVDGIDMHCYGRVPDYPSYSTWNEWDSILGVADSLCRIRGIRWAITEFNAPWMTVPNSFRTVFDSLRSLDCLSYDSISRIFFDSIRTLDPTSLFLPENYEDLRDTCAASFLLFTKYAFKNNCAFLNWWIIIHEYANWWYKTPNYPCGDQSSWRTFKQGIQGRYSGLYERDTSGVITGNPVRNAIKEIARSRKTNPE